MIVTINTFDDVGHSGSRDGGGGGEDTEADRGGGEGGDPEGKVRQLVLSFCLMKLVENGVKSFNQGVGVHSTFAS